MKEEYRKPELELILLDDRDIVTSSGEGEGEGDDF